MGVRRTDYIMIGANILKEAKTKFSNDDDDLWETFEPYMDYSWNKEINQTGIHCVFDGMSDRYIFLGEVIRKGNDYDGIGLFKLNVNELEVINQRVKGKIKELFDIDCEPNLLVFTHWS